MCFSAGKICSLAWIGYILNQTGALIWRLSEPDSNTGWFDMDRISLVYVRIGSFIGVKLALVYDALMFL